MAGSVPKVKPMTGPKLISHLTTTAKKYGFSQGDIISASVYASGATPMNDPGGRGGELWQLAKYSEAKSAPSPLVKDTGRQLKTGQTELANTQQGAAGTGKGDINVGGTVNTNVDNSKHDQYNVGNGSSTPDRRMLQYAALKDF